MAEDGSVDDFGGDDKNLKNDEEKLRHEEEEEREDSTEEFKAPAPGGMLPPPLRKTLHQAKDSSSQSSTSFLDEDSEPEFFKQRMVEPREPLLPVPYKEPDWSEIPPFASNYSLNVMKSGVELGTKLLNQEKSHYVIGRLANCDFQLEHPCVSRHHAVLQFGNFGISDGRKCEVFSFSLLKRTSVHVFYWAPIGL